MQWWQKFQLFWRDTVEQKSNRECPERHRRTLKYLGEESLFNHKTLLQPHPQFHIRWQTGRQMPIKIQTITSITIFRFLMLIKQTHTYTHGLMHTEKLKLLMTHQMYWDRCKAQQAKGHHSCTVNQSDWLDMPVLVLANFCGDLYPIWWIYLF